MVFRARLEVSVRVHLRARIHVFGALCLSVDLKEILKENREKSLFWFSTTLARICFFRYPKTSQKYPFSEAPSSK